jgi:hypothetical protein
MCIRQSAILKGRAQIEVFEKRVVKKMFGSEGDVVEESN